MLLIAVCTCAYRCDTLSLTILVSTYGFHTMSHAGSLEKRLPHMYATKKLYDFLQTSRLDLLEFIEMLRLFEDCDFYFICTLS